ncbi:hypothetical protein HCU40_24205 [Pseudanabaena biceps]|nr:hypothetical protein [Pseudanabaena biceps]
MSLLDKSAEKYIFYWSQLILGDRQVLTEAIANCFGDCTEHGYELAKIYAFWFGQPLPQWSETIDFNCSISQTNNHEIELSTEADIRPLILTILFPLKK